MPGTQSSLHKRLLLRFYGSPCTESLESGMSDGLFIPCPVLERNLAKLTKMHLRLESIIRNAEKCMPQWPTHFLQEILKFDSKVLINWYEKEVSQISHSEGAVNYTPIRRRIPNWLWICLMEPHKEEDI